MVVISLQREETGLYEVEILSHMISLVSQNEWPVVY